MDGYCDDNTCCISPLHTYTHATTQASPPRRVVRTTITALLPVLKNTGTFTAPGTWDAANSASVRTSRYGVPEVTNAWAPCASTLCAAITTKRAERLCDVPTRAAMNGLRVFGDVVGISQITYLRSSPANPSVIPCQRPSERKCHCFFCILLLLQFENGMKMVKTIYKQLPP